MIVESPLSINHDQVGRSAKDLAAMHPRYQRRQQQQATTAAEHEAAAHPGVPDPPPLASTRTIANADNTSTVPTATATAPAHPPIAENIHTPNKSAADQPKVPKRPSFDHINLHAPVVVAPAPSSPPTSRNSSMNLSDLRRRTSGTTPASSFASSSGGLNNLSSTAGGTGIAAKGVNFTSSTKFDCRPSLTSLRRRF